VIDSVFFVPNPVSCAFDSSTSSRMNCRVGSSSFGPGKTVRAESSMPSIG
jgi:hypothetical protein